MTTTTTTTTTTLKTEESITMVKTTYNIKEGTKSVFVEVKKEVTKISEEQYTNIIESAPFFRRLGGSETITKSYTSKGYVPVRLTSKNPDRDVKVVREFDF